jgi:hypothetical protein
MIIAASQQNSPDDDNTTIEDILEKYSVGTEHAKKPILPPKDPSVLGPLRDVDFSSIQMRASNIINRKNNPVRKTTAKLSPTLIDSSTYQEMIRYIAAMLKLVNDTCQSIQQNLGYMIIEERATPLSLDCPGNISKQRKDLVRLFKLADEKYRTPPPKKSKETTIIEESDEDDDEDIPFLMPDEAIDISGTSLILENDEEVTGDEHDDNQEVRKNNKKRHTCCACSITSTNKPTATFTTVPFPVGKLCPNTSSNQVRKSYYKRKNQRKEYLRRLLLDENDPRVTLKVCDAHELYLDQLTYCWYDEQNAEKTSTDIIKLPIDPNNPNESLPKAPVKNNKGKRKRQDTNNNNQTVSHKICHFVNCCTKGSSGVSFLRLPPKPILKQNSDGSKPRNIERMKYAVRKSFYSECARRIGLKPSDQRKEIRICGRHVIEKIVKDVSFVDNKGNKRSIKTNMYVPCTEGVCMLASDANDKTTAFQRKNKGLSTDRFLSRQIESIRNEPSGDTMLLLSQLLEAQEGNIESINPNVAKAAGIISSKNRQSMKVEIPQVFAEKEEQSTVVRYTHLTTKMVKRTTGFSSVASFLAFIIIVNDADQKKIERRCTYLSWLEEWCVYLEAVWCKSCTRWIDLEARYNISPRTLRTIFDSKLAIHINCVMSWPRFVSYEEDKLYRKQKWSETYKQRRIIMWDNTNINFCFKPSSADVQRNTYSAYYAGNCAKGSVFIQPCGWMGTHDLWVGAVSDSLYMTRSGVLKMHTDYIDKYEETNKTAFTILLDKGYRITTVAWRSGGQFVLQPSFARSDYKFTSYETIRGAAVAHDRAANERAVRYSKICGYIKSGLRQNESTQRLSDVWIAWAFQCNFIYKPVL